MGDLITLIATADPPAVADALLGLDEPGRRALVPRLRTMDAPDDALRVAGAACLPRAAQIVSWLRAPRFRAAAGGRTIAAVVRVLGAPGRPSLPAVATGLAARLRPHDEWALAAAVLRAADVPPPPTAAVVTGWIRELSGPVAGPLSARLAADPWLDRLLPEVFAIPGAGAALDDAWPPALLALAEGGRFDRAELVRLVLHRMAAGDRPKALRPVLELHRLLDPAPAERAEHRAGYVTMLGGPAAVASVALTALQSLDEAGRLAAASATILTRPEKKLVRAHLAWLGSAVARHPKAAGKLLEAVADGLANPAIDLAERALAVLLAHPGGLGVLRSRFESLDGDLRRQAAAALGLRTAPSARLFGPAPRPYAAEPMPAPIRTPADLTEAWAALGDDPLRDPIGLERLLAGLTAPFASSDNPRSSPGDRAGPATGDSADSAPPGLLDAMAAAVPPADPPAPGGLLGARLAELIVRRPPALLSTPARTDGHVDPARVLLRLVEAETDGRPPGPYDLAQALLRLPRRIDPGVVAAAGRLGSPAGRRFAAWLRAGGLPDPAMTVVAGPGRFATFPALDVPGLQIPDGLLAGPAQPVDAGPPPPGIACWPMLLPGHREIIAAHLQSYVGHRAANDVLPALARSGGPFGPAMALCLARGLADRHDRRPAVDALLHLAATGGLDAALLGRELTQLLATGDVQLGRLVPALADITRAGAPHVVWTVGHTLVPPLLRMDRPPQAMSDLLAVAASAAAATGARADLPEVTALAARPGRTRLAVEAVRLARTIAG